MFITWYALNSSHPIIELCAPGVELKSFKLAAEAERYRSETFFRAYGKLLAKIGSFK